MPKNEVRHPKSPSPGINVNEVTIATRGFSPKSSFSTTFIMSPDKHINNPTNMSLAPKLVGLNKKKVKFEETKSKKRNQEQFMEGIPKAGRLHEARTQLVAAFEAVAEVPGLKMSELDDLADMTSEILRQLR